MGVLASAERFHVRTPLPGLVALSLSNVKVDVPSEFVFNATGCRRYIGLPNNFSTGFPVRGLIPLQP